MAKVKIQGNASGTGVFTITPPATSTDRTLTLPDSAGTLVNTAPSTSGNVLTSDGTNWTSAAAAAGGVDGIVSTADATAIIIDSSENVGIGVTPKSTWHANFDALQMGEQAVLYAHADGIGNDSALYLGTNIYNDATEKYLRSDKSALYRQQSGKHDFYVTPSGTADTAMTWTNALTITNDGRGLSQFTAKAWVNFYASVGTGIRDSHNVSSIGDNATGDFSVNYTNSLASSNNSVSITNGSNNYSDGDYYPENTLREVRGGYCRFHTFNTGWSSRDPHAVCVMVFGD